MRNCFPEFPPPPEEYAGGKVQDEYEEMTVAEVMNGKVRVFSLSISRLANRLYSFKGSNPGLITLVTEYVDTLDVDNHQKGRIFEYLDFVRKRSTGELQTPATWIRNFVRSHPAYKSDSVVNEEITYDLLKEVDQMYASPFSVDRDRPF